MKFMNTTLIPIIIAVFTLFFVWKNKNDKLFISWIKKHWFYLPSIDFRLGRFFYFIGLALLLFSLADLRGPEEKIETNIPDQKTIIIIDSSASMLVEDIRPNRYEKAILLARHFIKNAFGHQVAVVLFSDNQKRIVPFTDDLDLLDSRVAGLSGLNILHGGSNISQAILESVQYFKEKSGNKNEVVGNILVFTDAEEHDGLPIEVIKGDISLAMVGVGSLNGGPIPQRSRNNTFRGYKMHNGKKIISKLDEGFLKKFGEMVENYKYWVVSSYSIPTEQILRFFRGNYEEKISKSKITTRPVYGHFIAILGVILFSISFFFKLRKSFIIPLALVFVIAPLELRAQDEEPKINPATLEKLDKVKEGAFNRKEKLNLALELIKEGDFKTGVTIFEENIKPSDPLPYKFNLSTGLLGKRDLKKGISNLKSLYELYKDNPQIEEAIRKNILFALKNEQSERKQEQQEKEKKEKNQDKKDENKKQKGDNGQSDKKDQENSDQEKKEQKNKEDKEQDKESEDKKNSKKPKDYKEKEKQLKQKRKMVKIPAMIKQLMGQDRKLQEKYIDTSTQDKQRNNKNRDW